jgi:hypothetical protein
MIGVILWCDPADQKAVIWCEDQGDLAFLSSPETVHLPDTFVDVGDVVEFDIQAVRNTRLAKNATLADQNWSTGQNDARQTVHALPARLSGGETAVIIPFRTGPTVPAMPAKVSRRKLRG